MAYFITMETYFITMETSASWMIRGIHVFQTSWHASHGGPAKGETVTLRWGVELCSSTQAALNFDLVRSITNWTFHSFTVCCLSQWVYILYHDSSTERLLTENSRGSGACTVLYTLGPVNQTGLYCTHAELSEESHPTTRSSAMTYLVFLKVQMCMIICMSSLGQFGSNSRHFTQKKDSVIQKWHPLLFVQPGLREWLVWWCALDDVTENHHRQFSQFLLDILYIFSLIGFEM